jgi:hypothetical protein
MVGHWYATGAYQLNSDEAKKQGKIWIPVERYEISSFLLLWNFELCYEISSYARKACRQNSYEAEKQAKIRMVGHWHARRAYQLNFDLMRQKQGKIRTPCGAIWNFLSSSVMKFRGTPALLF